MATADRSFYVSAWRVDPVLDCISCDGTNVHVEPRHMRLLLLLMQHAGEIVSIRQIEAEIWAGGTVPANAVHQAITQLRRALGDSAKQPKYIQTVVRRGYRLIAPVQQAPAPSAAPEPVAPGAEISTFNGESSTILLPSVPASSPRKAADQPAARQLGHLRQLISSNPRTALALLGACLVIGMGAAWAYLESRNAERARASADEVSNFMLNVFSASTSRYAGDQLTARELTASAAQRITTDLQQQLPMRAAMLEAIAASYAHRGLAPAAIAPAKEAVTILRRIGTPSDLANALMTLAHSYRDINEEGLAEPVYREALQIYREIDPASSDVGYAVGSLGFIEVNRGRPRQALGYLNESLDIMRRALGPRHSDIGNLLTRIAIVHTLLNEWANAEKVLRQAVDILKVSMPPENPDLVQARSLLGEIIQRQGRADEAGVILEQVLEMRRQVNGPEGWPIAQVLSQMSDVRFDQGRIDEGEEFHRQAMAALAKPETGSDVQRAYIQQKLAAKLMDLKQFQRSERLLREVRTLYATNGQHQREIGTAEQRLAEALLAQGKSLDEAKSLLESSAANYRATNAPPSLTAYTENVLGEVLYRNGQTEAGRRLILESDRTLNADPLVSKGTRTKARQRVEWLARQRA